METITKYTVSIVSIGIYCMLIIGNAEIFAVAGDGVKNAALKQNDKQAWLSKGDVLNRMGNFSEAIIAYDAALMIDPNYVNAWDGKGWSLNELGNYTQAIPYLDKALKIDPNHVDGLVFKSQALYNIGNYTGAKYYSDKAFGIDPESPALHRLPEVLVKEFQ